MHAQGFWRAVAIVLLSALVGTGVLAPLTLAQDATPPADSGLPEGALGTQMQWLVDYLDTPESEAATIDLTSRFAPWVLADVPADQLQQILSNIRTQFAPVTIDTETMVISKEVPPTNADFYLVSEDGTKLPTSLSIDRTSGLISSLWFAAPIAPVATLTPAETATATATTQPTETATPAPTQTATLEPTRTATLEPTETATLEPTNTATVVPTETPTLEPTRTPTLEPTNTPTLKPTETATLVPTDTPTLPPTETATLEPTKTATLEPTNTATRKPTETATLVPTNTATLTPTETATLVPTNTATLVPTNTATSTPTNTATPSPSNTATLEPTETATPVPTDTATLEPTETATLVPTKTATLTATSTATPTATQEPTETATLVPTHTATLAPTETATLEPTETATLEPTKTPTLKPTNTATLVPTNTATLPPAETATLEPTETATLVPTSTDTLTPTLESTKTATMTPTDTGTPEPTEVVVAASPRATEQVTEAASPVASPVASPEASPSTLPFPAGPLGEQAAWTWSTLNTDAAPVSEREIEAHLSPEVLAQAPATQIAASLVQLQQAYGPFTIEADSVMVSENEPPTTLSYVIVGKDGTRMRVDLSLDPSNDLLNGFLISPASPVASPAASPLPAGITDTDVSFTSGDDTLYGSFMAPADYVAEQQHPAALIISGSGPTDRNGNSGNLPLETNRNLALTLAEAGIPSLRYDKVGAGQTGLASHADGTGIDYELFLQEVRDAARELASQPGVDPDQLIIVGHSEGALFALALAREMTQAGPPPAAVMLVAPLSVRYLDILHGQVTEQGKAAVASGQMTQAAFDTLTVELDALIDSLRTTGELPDTTIGPELSTIFTPANAAFLAQIDKVDPAEVAADLPNDMPVLVLLGEKDAQVTPAQVRQLMDGFAAAGNNQATLVMLPNADHTLRIVEGTPHPIIDYRNPNLPFSHEAVMAIDAFLARHGLARGA